MTAKHRARTRTVPRLAGVTVLAAGLIAVQQSGIAQADTDDGVNWDAVAQCESGGNWATSTGNGFYGGLQFTASTWRAYGGQGMPQHASREQQIAVAKRVKQGQGIGAWPVCGRHAWDGASSRRTYTSPKPATAPRHAAPTHPAPPAVTTTPDVLMGPELVPGARTYTVAQHDCLSDIATTQRVPGGWQRLAQANHIAGPDYTVYPGQAVVLP
jgi:resuscitation-promoting factor RpfA